MKLIFLNRFFFPDHSATSQILTDLAFDLARDQHEVHVITSRQRIDEPDASLPAEEAQSGVRIHRVWTSTFGRSNLAGRAIDYATFYLSAGARLMSLAGKGDVIIAKTDPPLISVVAAWVARRRGALLVNWLQDVFPEVADRLGVRVMQGPLGALAKRLRNYSLRTAKANVVLGERMAAHVDETLGGAAKSTIIENWSDGALVQPMVRESNPLRASWGLAERFVVGYSGNMGRAHEFDTILGACERLRGDEGIVFLFIGAGRQREWIEAEAAKRGLENVAFQPYQPREMLAMSLSAADVHLVTLQPFLEGLIVPSKYYGIAAAGRPTVFIGDVDGEIARLVRREECGAAVASGDAEGLAKALRRLRDDAAETARMGTRARQAFERSHDRPVAHGRWDQLLKNLAGVTRG